MTVIAITRYYAQSGHEEQVATLLANHWELLHDEGLTTDRRPYVMRDPHEPGLFVEVLEWKDDDAPDRAWDHDEVSALWDTIQSYCEQDIEPEYYEPLSSLQAGGG